ncbi:3-methyl-2-oxobutanoate hydroxymethyltransferase [Vibrio sp. 070316B]|uniref:3-methyl-2-oxobutanoate hydroxymethyltransferase n=1 Tax=Vibrio sp. 070316B TaxID=2607608 RepID=UPI001493A050|nr:3-methyl-2-oxobutanoate hydroxymethyltransferase [Vibrio sp. 070316B]NOI39429.1 3-methyl-2-oxobutanoate hydroxymethyltransferase [Vibrio sp. 070316B]
MSKVVESQRTTVTTLMNTARERKIACLTAYTAPVAKIVDEHADLILVGDTLGMVVHGMPSTVGVTLDMMILHGQTVMRSTNKALVIVDMPFGTYETSPETAFENAKRIMQETGCCGVKIEAFPGADKTAKYLVERGIPVIGHIGIRPQAINATGGFKVVGKTKESQTQLLSEAEALRRAGCFAIVLEGVPASVSQEIVKHVDILTIGIGASETCHGQILVTDDMLGLFDWTPKFVKRYANLRYEIDRATREYVQEVKDGTFPDQSHMYKALGDK